MVFPPPVEQCKEVVTMTASIVNVFFEGATMSVDGDFVLENL